MAIRDDLPDFKAMEERQQAQMAEQDVIRLLDSGRAWPLAPTLLSGGSLVFGHATLGVCGHHIAAAVHSCLDSGARRIVALGVLHARTSDLDEARARVEAGGDVMREPAWGIQGPHFPSRPDWQSEFSLSHFQFLLGFEARRRGVPMPELVAAYPFLAAGAPEVLPGIGRLRELMQGAVVVASIDPFHHGIGYGDDPKKALAPDAGGLALARQRVARGLDLLGAGDYAAYAQHCKATRSDGRDVGQVLRYLLGPLAGRVLDIVADDMSAAYGKPAPTWVACALIELTPAAPPAESAGREASQSNPIPQENAQRAKN